jgi:hypothetical protein
MEADPRQHAAAYTAAGTVPAAGPLTAARRRADLLADNPFNTLKLGCDFLRHHALPQIDFATAHLCATVRCRAPQLLARTRNSTS